MNTKYFKVQAKCGHVGRNYYILKWFYVKALTGEEAAKVVRDKPRVKHNQKDAIRNVKEITFEEYLTGLRLNSEDMYFKSTSKQEQEFYNAVKQEEIYPEVCEEHSNYKKKRNEMKYLINHGATYNNFFLNFKQKKVEDRRIIDRLEELYNLCLKPIEIAVQDPESNEWKTVKVENTVKNRFLNNYYFNLSRFLRLKKETDASYSDLQNVYDYFINHEEIEDETRRRIAKLEKIDTNKKRKYWMADYKQRVEYEENLFNQYKEKENKIKEGLKEINKLEEM